jgi:hypothetical protein
MTKAEVVSIVFPEISSTNKDLFSIRVASLPMAGNPVFF